MRKDSSISEEASYIAYPVGNETPSGCPDGFTANVLLTFTHPIQPHHCKCIDQIRFERRESKCIEIFAGVCSPLY